MIDDFQPVRRRKKSLDTNTNRSSKEQTPRTTDTFIAPEQAAAQDSLPQAPSHEPIPPMHVTLPGSKKPKTRVQAVTSKLKLRWPPTKKEALVSAVIILVVSTGIGTFALTRKGPAPVAAGPKVAKVVKAEPKTFASTLSGLQVDPSLNSRPVIATIIENSPDARPQSGLSQAGVVFEAIAEGGITRFLALFQDQSPADIGPVRSVRPYFIQWAMGFDAPIAHVGGSPLALNNIREWGTKDLDQFSNSGAYRRVSSRSAPHNMYTTFDSLLQLSTSKGFTSSTFTSFARKKDAPAKLPNAKSIDIAVSSAMYNSHYDYDAGTNSYKRSMAGGAHMDAGTSTQINPKVVIGLVMPYSIFDGKYSNYGTIGSGQAYVFQDGLVTMATWIKSDNASQFSFTDSNGHPLSFNAGQTWITAVSDPAKITYAP